MRARLGVLEDVRGSVGGGLVSVNDNERARARFIHGRTPRGRAARERGPVVYGAAHRRIGSSEHNILVTQTNIANTNRCLGRLDKASRMQRDVYWGRLKLNGEEHGSTIIAANNYANTLIHLERIEEANLGTVAQNDTRGATRPRRE